MNVTRTYGPGGPTEPLDINLAHVSRTERFLGIGDQEDLAVILHSHERLLLREGEVERFEQAWHPYNAGTGS